MTTPAVLAARSLRKLKVIGATETASAEDLAVMLESVTDFHNALDGMGLLRWTLDTIPPAVDLAYVQGAAFLAAPDFSQPQEPTWMAQAVGLVQQYVGLPTSGPIYSEEL